MKLLVREKWEMEVTAAEGEPVIDEPRGLQKI